MSRWFLVALLATLGTAGCSGVAAFWSGYQADNIVNQHSDQGPWGGERWVRWHAAAGTFKPDVAAEFAETKGWRCEPGVSYSADAMRGWVFGQAKVFPLFFEEGVRNAHTERFPRSIEVDSVVVRCETEWTRVSPGTGQVHPAYGYIHISNDGRDMAIYHLWGEA